jgi:hypothetical protein
MLMDASNMSRLSSSGRLLGTKLLGNVIARTDAALMYARSLAGG